MYFSSPYIVWSFFFFFNESFTFSLKHSISSSNFSQNLNKIFLKFFPNFLECLLKILVENSKNVIKIFPNFTLDLSTPRVMQNELWSNRTLLWGAVLWLYTFTWTEHSHSIRVIRLVKDCTLGKLQFTCRVGFTPW